MPNDAATGRRNILCYTLLLSTCSFPTEGSVRLPLDHGAPAATLGEAPEAQLGQAKPSPKQSSSWQPWGDQEMSYLAPNSAPAAAAAPRTSGSAASADSAGPHGSTLAAYSPAEPTARQEKWTVPAPNPSRADGRPRPGPAGNFYVRSIAPVSPLSAVPAPAPAEQGSRPKGGLYVPAPAPPPVLPSLASSPELAVGYSSAAAPGYGLSPGVDSAMAPSGSVSLQPVAFTLRLVVLAAENTSVLATQGNTLAAVVASLLPGISPQQVHVRCLNCGPSATGRRMLASPAVDVRVIVDCTAQQRPGVQQSIQRLQSSQLTNALQAAGLPVVDATLLDSGVAPTSADKFTTSSAPPSASPPIQITVPQKGSSAAVLFGAISGAIVALLILAGFAFFCFVRSKRGKSFLHREDPVPMKLSGSHLQAVDEEAPGAGAPLANTFKWEDDPEKCSQVSRLLSLAIHQTSEERMADGSFYRGAPGSGSFLADADVPYQEQQQREKVAAALRSMEAEGRLFAGRYRMKADTIRPRGPNLELQCEDEFQSLGGRLMATFFVREEDFEQELAIRGLVPPETMLAGVQASYNRGLAVNGAMLPSCIISAAGSYTLAKWMRGLRGVPHPGQLLAVIESIALALDSFHSRGFVHGGLRPTVVLRFSRENVARLADTSSMSLARHPCNPHPAPRYAAPEMVEMKEKSGMLRMMKASPAADMWSLGCIIFELYTGSPIFDGRYTDSEVMTSLSSPQLLPWALNKEFFDEAIANPAARMAVQNLLCWTPSERWDTPTLLASSLLQDRAFRSRPASGEMSGFLPSPLPSCEYIAELLPQPPPQESQPSSSLPVAAAVPPLPPKRSVTARQYASRASRKQAAATRVIPTSPFSANARDWVLAESDLKLQPMSSPAHFTPRWSREVGAATQDFQPLLRVSMESRIAEVSKEGPEAGKAGSEEGGKDAEDGKPGEPCTPQGSAEPLPSSEARRMGTSRRPSAKTELQPPAGLPASETHQQTREASPGGTGKVLETAIQAVDQQSESSAGSEKESREDFKGAIEPPLPQSSAPERQGRRELEDTAYEPPPNPAEARTSKLARGMAVALGLSQRDSLRPTAPITRADSLATTATETLEPELEQTGSGLHQMLPGDELLGFGHAAQEQRQSTWSAASTAPPSPPDGQPHGPFSPPAKVVEGVEKGSYPPALPLPPSPLQASPAAAVDPPGEMIMTRSLKQRHMDSVVVESRYNNQLLQLLQPKPAQPPRRSSQDVQLQQQIAELGGTVSLWPVPVTALQELKGSLLVVSTDVARTAATSANELGVLRAIESGTLPAAKRVRPVSRSGLEEEPLYPIQIGSLHLLRLRVAAGNATGRIALMVDGVNKARLFTSATDPGVNLKIVGGRVDADGSAWEGTALWDTNYPSMAYLASHYGQHACLRLTLTLPVKGEPETNFTLQQNLFALVSTRRPSPGAVFRRSQAFEDCVRQLPWVQQEAVGVVLFATVVRRNLAPQQDGGGPASFTPSESNAALTFRSRPGRTEDVDD